MRAVRLEGHHGQPITVDLCLPCQSLWFDGFESLRLSPGSTLRLFRLVGDQPPAPNLPYRRASQCPRCGDRLRRVSDIQRSTRFEYERCPAGHGRLITFYNFLREKDFIRPLSAAEVRELRARIQSVHCSNCGAPIDLAAHTSCVHCGAALSLVDLTHGQDLIAQLQQADRPAHRPARPADATLALDLARARREAASAFDAFEPPELWFRDASTVDPVGAGVISLARWLKKRL